ncbi:GbsR/MarR family transcriptional regulator [Longimicrobium terrae]|uniref:DNA-binding transcriptional regulator GbsR (MarR family) n=1 Tax=Longimicrobium terrae TaxID=1639882 RepID=A0A841H0X9_9BACT|nr:MarR family transcriptional regulator [Longimicrobium terrae]MBB4637160.1 DNA-binding transcriptional regulator GbsR (MarR family) [Longimicrobium terrae]MBB6071579.1 DNA-binding transcriptional regulator GbsR (MarR family) [Longimicrobium terrae]NNC30002.1 MarR family transcriptional regulator [Longimicrobium terrae]
MQQTVLQFVERMALICEKEGMPRIAGRIFGYLLASDQTYSLEELAEHLQASKASVSTNARMLEQFGMIQRVSVLGDRRDFYRVEDDPWERMLRVAQSRWRDMANAFADARERLPDPAGRVRVAEAERFHRLLITDCDALIDRWHALLAAEARTPTETAGPGV